MKTWVYDLGYRDIRPDFIHFTLRRNLPEILAAGKIGGIVPMCELGDQGKIMKTPASGYAVYAYNLDLIQETHYFATFPFSLLRRPEETVAILFSSDHALWWHYMEESATRFDRALNGHHAVPIVDPIVLSCEEAFSWIGTTIQEVQQQYKKTT